MQSAGELSRVRGELDTRGWYAAYVKHQHEKKAAEQLQRKGMEVLLPLQKVVHRWKDRNKTLSLPLFPSYVFIHANLEDKWKIVSTPGVFFLVETQGRAATIPLQEIESIRRLVSSGVPAQAHPYLTSGDRVRIRTGPLQGVAGVLGRMKNQCRVVLNIELLQKAISIEVELSNLELVQDSSSYACPVAAGARPSSWAVAHSAGA
jgi:transcription termination/antitermination protein NusG